MDVRFVCTGNTCRSPMAAALFNHLAGAGGPVAASAGIAAAEGMPADPTAVEAVREAYGIDLRPHRTTPLRGDLIREAALVVAMTAEHRDWIVGRYPEAGSKIRVLTEFDPADPNPRSGIPDPFGGSLECYRKTLSKMEPPIRAILASIRSTGRPQGV